MKLWFKEWKDARMVGDTVIEDYSDETRTHKIFNGVKEAAYRLDIGTPQWFDATVAAFKKHGKARFNRDAFIEPVDFDYLEIEILEEDY
ncbi:MAG: hypothetical protein IJT32_05690 [Lachnospiraceae bacterium]|nr:hypothetical protein [Lachnospiraceae bacterium]